MSFKSGDYIGTYAIQSQIGAGAMGEVYRALDTKLGREVAIKVLPKVFSQDKDRLLRFEREAKLLASMNHPNIAAIYDLDKVEATQFLVLELVPGETLAERIARGPLPAEEALPLFQQIAEALEAAHDKGIVHRDLKPANIKITPEDKIKVLDFGLAKAVEESPNDSVEAEAPTRAREHTHAGVVLGTAAYMSPEQARGRHVDKQTDIWAFGCVLYEALTGKGVFTGQSLSEVIAEVLKEEPDWSALPSTTPSSISVLIRRCIHKDPSRRLHDIADARIEIEDALLEPTRHTMELRPSQSAKPSLMLPWVVAFLMTAVAGFSLWRLGRQEPWATQPVSRFTVPLHQSADPSPSGQMMALSPDGTKLVYVGRAENHRQLFLRRLDEFEATAVPNTDGARFPFFSPDGNWVGFLLDNQLKKLSLVDGVTQTLCPVESWAGGSWGPDGTIVFSQSPSGPLYRVPSSGGTPEAITTVDSEKGERGHTWPHILPGGQAVLFTIRLKESADRSPVAVQSLETNERRILTEDGLHAQYISPGQIVLVRSRTLLALPFDLEQLTATGHPVPMADGIRTPSTVSPPPFALSDTGVLAYVPEVADHKDILLRVNRNGTTEPLSDELDSLAGPRLSPDGNHLAITISTGSRSDVWIRDMERGTQTRLTFEGNNTAAVWSPDGKRLVFASDRNGTFNLFLKNREGTAEAEQLTRSEYPQFPTSWTPDGQAIVFMQPQPAKRFDIYLLPLDGKGKPQPILDTTFTERLGVLSPNGKWLAYVSNESGPGVYVRAFPGPGSKWHISTEGGTEPLWSRQGLELFYRQGNKMMVVRFTPGAEPEPGKPRLLFEETFEENTLRHLNYDIMPDGSSFVMIQKVEELSSPQIHVVVNWHEELKQKTRYEDPDMN
jgi:serine/threonine protein kinase